MKSYIGHWESVKASEIGEIGIYCCIAKHNFLCMPFLFMFMLRKVIKYVVCFKCVPVQVYQSYESVKALKIGIFGYIAKIPTKNRE